MNKECLRCGSSRVVTKIGFALKHFVCDVCRVDESEWDFNKKRPESIPITVSDMEYQSPLPEMSDGIDEQDKVLADMFSGRVAVVESSVPVKHKRHNVLGNYCWDCKQTTGLIPGWTKATISKQQYRVVWADGTKDDSDKCDSCLRHDCKHPVHTDQYKEKNK